MTYTVSGAQLKAMLGGWQLHGPAYLDLANSLHTLVIDGRLPLGSRVPAERTLAPTLGVGRNTVTAAYQTLREQGLLVSRRGSGSFVAIPADSRPARRVASWVPARGDDGAIDFTIASPPAPATLLHWAHRMSGGDLDELADDTGYDLQGIPQLREQIAERYTRQGLPTTPDEIMVTSGGQHAWALLIRLLSRPGDQVLVESPTYPSAVDAIRSLRRKPVSVGLDATGWNAELIEAVTRAHRPALAYFMPDFHNPTGLVMPVDVRTRIVAAAKQAGTCVVFDHTLADLALDDPAGTRQLLPGDRAEHVILIGSLSKTCWAGLRVGWLRSSSTVVSRLVTLRAAADAGNSVIPQLLARHLLTSYEEVLRQRRAMLVERREALMHSVREALPGWTFIPPRGGFSLWVDVGARVSSQLSLLARDHGVLVLPGPRFGADGTLDNYLRLPFVQDPAVAAEGVKRLAAAFERVAPGCVSGGGGASRRRSVARPARREVTEPMIADWTATASSARA